MNGERFQPVLRLLDEAPFHRSRRSRLAWGAVGLIALTVIVYLRAVLINGLFWQDRSTLNGVASLFTLGHLWTHASGAYRPLGLTLLWAERRGFAEWALPYHCVELIVHAASCVLLWLILRRLGVRGAWLAAALFAVHPGQVQLVAWLTQQPALICTMCCLLSIWLYLRWSQIKPPLPEEMVRLGPPRDPPSRVGHAAALAMCVVAVLCGPQGISLPIVLLLLVRWKRGPLSRSDWFALAPFFAVALLAVAANVFFHRSSPDPLGPAPSLTALQRVTIAGSAVGFYVMNLLRLYPVELIQPRWNPSAGIWNAAPILLILVLGLIAWRGSRRWGVGPLVCLLLFLALLLPNIITVLSERAPAIYVAEFHQYLASAVPLSLLAAALVGLSAWFSTLMPLRASRAVMGIIGIGLLAPFAFLQALGYHDADSAFQKALLHDPSNHLVRAQYALLLLDEEPSRALKVLDEAQPATDGDLTLLDARARVYLAVGRNDEAISDYWLAQRLAPEHPAIPLGLARAYDAAGTAAMVQGRRDNAFENYTNALAACQTARELDPKNPSVDDCVGMVLLHEGRFAESIDRFNAALSLDSGYAAAHVHKAQAFFNGALQGDPDIAGSASDELREALRIDPTNAEAFCAMANIQFRSRNFAAAELEYRSALRLNPGSAQVWSDLGFAQSAQNRFPEAIQSFERALSLQADAQEALRGKRLAQAQLANENKKS